MFSVKIPQFCGNLRKVVGATLFNTDYVSNFVVTQVKLVGKPPNPWYLFWKRWDGNFEWDFPVKYGG